MLLPIYYNRFHPVLQGVFEKYFFDINPTASQTNQESLKRALFFSSHSIVFCISINVKLQHDNDAKQARNAKEGTHIYHLPRKLIYDKTDTQEQSNQSDMQSFHSKPKSKRLLICRYPIPEPLLGHAFEKAVL